MITDGLMAFFKMAAMSSLATWPPTRGSLIAGEAACAARRGWSALSKPHHVGQLAGVARAGPVVSG